MDQTDSSTLKESESLPEIGISEILGLLNLLQARGGREDIYKLAAELNMEFGETLTVIRAAEMLKLVHTPGGDVVMESAGNEIARAKIKERKPLLKAQMVRIPVFDQLTQYLNDKEEKEADRDEVLERLAELLPNASAEQSFSTLVNWGRYAELFGYNDDSQMFYLDDQKPHDLGAP